MHLRRALLLFAIVLGFAALSATVSQAPRRDRVRPPAAASLPPGGVRPPVRLELSADEGPRSLRLAAGNAATLTVAVREPGQVEMESPPVISPAAPSTPASFPLLIDGPGRYPVLFRPAASGERRRVATLIVTR